MKKLSLNKSYLLAQVAIIFVGHCIGHFCVTFYAEGAFAQEELLERDVSSLQILDQDATATNAAKTNPATTNSAVINPLKPYNYQLSGAIDLYAPIPLQNAAFDDDRYRVRSLEIALHGPLDSLFDVVLRVSGDEENGSFRFGLHEAFVSTAQAIPRSRLRAGKFLLGVGVLNQVHPRHWPFPTAPRAHVLFFDPESGRENASDTGFEYQFENSNSLGLGFTAGVTSGYKFGHFHEQGSSRPLAPTHYLRPNITFGTSPFAPQLGFNYIARTDSVGQLRRIFGLDFRFREGRAAESASAIDVGQPRWLLLSEAYHRFSQTDALPVEEEVGGYAFVQRALNARWGLGFRLDFYSVTSLRDASGEHRDNLNLALVPLLSFAPSASSQVRMAYTYGRESKDGNSLRIEQKIEFQLVGLIGVQP